MTEFGFDAEVIARIDEDWHNAIVEITRRVGSAETIGVVTALAGGSLETDVQAFDYLHAAHPEAIPLLMDRFQEIGDERRSRELKAASSFKNKLRMFIGIQSKL